MTTLRSRHSASTPLRRLAFFVALTLTLLLALVPLSRPVTALAHGPMPKPINVLTINGQKVLVYDTAAVQAAGARTVLLATGTTGTPTGGVTPDAIIYDTGGGDPYYLTGDGYIYGETFSNGQVECVYAYLMVNSGPTPPDTLHSTADFYLNGYLLPPQLEEWDYTTVSHQLLETNCFFSHGFYTFTGYSEAIWPDGYKSGSGSTWLTI